MFYLIGGPPRCGKTTLSKKLAKELKLPWLSADSVEGMVWASTNKFDLKEKFPKGMMRKKTGNSNDLMYSTYTPAEIMKAYKEQAKTSWPAIDAMVEAELKAGHDYIIEGHQIHPKFAAQLLKKYGKKNITVVFIVKENVEDIISGAKKNVANYDWFIQKTKKESTYHKIAEMISLYSKFILKEATKYKLPVFRMDKKFHVKLSEVVEFMK
jgi:2-phosphoglycerate kinase